MIPGTVQSLPVGDPRRPRLARLLPGMTVAVAACLLFTLTKLIKPIYLHAPWFNDPYDTVLSFTVFFVPLTTAVTLVRVWLCRTSEPLPLPRVVAIIRGSRVVAATSTLEILSAWIAVAVSANRAEWSPAATGLLLVLLAITTAATANLWFLLRSTLRLVAGDGSMVPLTFDWLWDATTLARREVSRFGRFQGLGLRVVDWIDFNLVGKSRRHSIGAAGAAAASFSLVVFGWQAFREGYDTGSTLLVLALGFCGMFAFLVLAGSYLGVARSSHRLHGLRRRALAARDSLWRIVGNSPAHAGPAQLAMLLGWGAGLAFILTFLAETTLRLHPGTIR